MFKAVIHTDTKLTLCEKLYYLRSHLAGEAFDLIKNLTLTDENYNTALELLENRYDNIPKIVNYHVNCILELPSFTKCTSEHLRSLIANVKLHLGALKNLEQPVDKWDILLINILAKKVDSYTYRGFHLERDAKVVPSMAEFTTFLEKRAIAMENTAEEKLTAEKQPHKQQPMKSGKASFVASGVASNINTCAAA
ncbi:uncharacterized protein LOC126381391 isoform X1 [Pectinophora gossypiella]|uniref:uncharacterized protein LOC126377719 isoform X2 n=1 Tax=Pectinophora gossypiella TaxID=13191 RepID=UPI00214ED650|nr:uncharacterized protein LOC126377719 isoform X2 [Pectinophora gossypiella]XP_049886832.1 uncharacterized protein LOC126381391 isoform X1 [Pectinophora gossypiella]